MHPAKGRAGLRSSVVERCPDAPSSRLASLAPRGSKRERLFAWVLSCVVVLLVLLAPTLSEAQLRHMRGQNVAPVFEGWQHNDDGTFTFFFGYMNRNHEELVDLPVGPNNFFAPGPEDRGQPTHFLTRRQRFVFTFIVPADQGLEERLTWTLTAHGRTDTVQGWLQPEWEADDGVIQMNLGPGGATCATARR